VEINAVFVHLLIPREMGHREREEEEDGRTFTVTVPMVLPLPNPGIRISGEL
jgi:hypothetical protein